LYWPGEFGTYLRYITGGSKPTHGKNDHSLSTAIHYPQNHWFVGDRLSVFAAPALMIAVGVLAIFLVIRVPARSIREPGS